MMPPVLKELKDRMGDQIKIFKVNVDEHNDVAAHFQVNCSSEGMRMERIPPPIRQRMRRWTRSLARNGMFLLGYDTNSLKLTMIKKVVLYFEAESIINWRKPPICVPPTVKGIVSLLLQNAT